MSIVEAEVEQTAAQGAVMEITVSRQELLKELTATQSVVERKTTIPILSNFLIEADGERLNIRVGSRIYDMERSLIEATLDYFKGNKRRAADALGCSLKTLYNKLNGYSQSQECANS